MHIYLLGPVEISQDGREIPLSGQQQRALVAALASELGRVVPAERLIETIWAGYPPRHARVKLQGIVSALRKALGGSAHGSAHNAGLGLVTREPGYLISRDGVTVDLLDYRALLRLATSETDLGQIPAAADHLAQALALWRGPALADVRTPVLSGVAEALERGRLLAMERKAECDLLLGRPEIVAEDLTTVLAAHPFREGARAALMVALYRCGCRAEALECYRAGRQLLREQLGIEPGQALRQLHERMLADDPLLTTRNSLARAEEFARFSEPEPPR
jgi:DNA-binding SARP family transcriptional activator